jgi:protein-tyrosine phosphatase
MTTTVTLPGGIVVRAGGQVDQPKAEQPDWGVYADPCWEGWPGILLDWPDFGVPRAEAPAIAAIIEALARATSGQDVLVGCLGGTGRTGTILACMAILAGVPPDLAAQWVRDHYRRKAVEMPAQEDWVVDRFARADTVRKHAEQSSTRIVKGYTHAIRRAMGEALQKPELSPFLEWPVDGVLAITQRPLRAHPIFGGSRHNYPAEARPAIELWITRLMEQGVRSVVVLTSTQELAHYELSTASDGGLLALYEARGLHVVHFPADDPAHDVMARDAFDAAVDEIAFKTYEALREIPLPAVIHCSAAIDRSPPVAARVKFRFEVGGAPA